MNNQLITFNNIIGDHIIYFIYTPVIFSPLFGLTPNFPPEGASMREITGYIPAPIGGRMSEGQEGGVIKSIYNI